MEDLAAPITPPNPPLITTAPDRKSTRLNSSHRCSSYAVFCLKKKTRANRVLAEIFRRHEDVARQWLAREAAAMFGVTIGAARVELANLLQDIVKPPGKSRLSL